MLKLLSAAERDGDHIYGVILGTAVNHGGKTNGYTVPNPLAQAGAISRALREAGVGGDQISYVEAHGTGTRLGDPIEVAALSRAFGGGDRGDRVCLLGSAKSNIGHCESAAGIAGLTKVLLQMQHGEIVPSLHSERLNPHIAFEQTPFRVNQTLCAWEREVVQGREQPRLAGLSSFGAGGSNAHMIVSDYVASAEPVASRGGPVAVLLSARTGAQLRQKVEDLAGYVEAQGAVDLARLGYTLQLGRESLEERLAVVVGSVAELGKRLRGWLAGEPGVDVLEGQGRGDRELWQMFASDADLQETVGRWLEGGRLERLAGLWVRGLVVDWARLYGTEHPRRLPLPVYPFSRERFWFDPPQPATQDTSTSTSTSTMLHPLLHRNVSTVGAQRFHSRFTGTEWFFTDHRVCRSGTTEEKTLPGVAYLEMVRAAIEQGWPSDLNDAVLELQNIVWMTPLVLVGEAQVSVSLWERSKDGDHCEFKVCSGEKGERTVHCQGRAIWTVIHRTPSQETSFEKHLQLPALMPNIVYAAFERKGLMYGPAFQPISALHVDAESVLAELSLPTVVLQSAPSFVLHPSIMDGALQACAALIEGWTDASLRDNTLSQPPTKLPFALESLRVLHPFTARMYAIARWSSGACIDDRVSKLDIDLHSENGTLCLQIKGFTAREIGPPNTQSQIGGPAQQATEPEESLIGLMTLAPVWQASAPRFAAPWPLPEDRTMAIVPRQLQLGSLRSHFADMTLLAINHTDSVELLSKKLRDAGTLKHLFWIVSTDEALDPISGQECGVLLGFRLIKALLVEGYAARDLGWTIITERTQAVGSMTDNMLDPTHSSVHGLVGCLAKEYPNWKVRLVDVGSGECPWDPILRLAASPTGEANTYRDSEWYTRRLFRLATHELPEPPAFRHKGVYVLIGGAGGIGEVFSSYLIEKWDARVVWIGRRPHDAGIQAKQDLLAQGGGTRPLYFAADATQLDQLSQVGISIRERFGCINGVIHSAIVLADRSLALMSESDFRKVLSAKVDVAVRIKEVFGGDPLDFLLYFSSIQSFSMSAGQSNYAAGCSFTDAYANWQRDRAHYLVKVINWAYWGTVGVVATAHYQQRMAKLGVGSIDVDEGLESIAGLLQGHLDQLIVLRTIDTNPAKTLGVTELPVLRNTSATSLNLGGGIPSSVKSTLSELTRSKILIQWPDRRASLDRVLVNLLRMQMMRLGWYQDVSGAWQKTDSPNLVPIHSMYNRWSDQTLKLLNELGARTSPSEMEDPHRAWKTYVSENKDMEGLAAQLNLVDTTMTSLGPILQGQVRATDVLFPQSSLSLVESVYKHHPVADYFNEAVASIVGEFLRQNAATSDHNFRLLEIGAGTGGTTDAILRRIDSFASNIREYCYTDVSRMFLLHGEKTFSAGRPFLRSAILDIEKPLRPQGIEQGVYNVVIAANVLHATRSIRQTLRHAKAALRKDGLLLLNELADTSVYAHLTFGLLDGWWAFDDGHLRLPGSPGLSPDGWQRVLEEEGFHNVSFPASAGLALGQQIVVAYSDGVYLDFRSGQRNASVEVLPHATMVGSRTISPTVNMPPGATRTNLTASAPHARLPKDVLLQKAIENWVIGSICTLLKVDQADVDSSTELSELGFDSISLTGLANYVNEAHGLAILPTIFFEHTTIQSFTDYLIRQYGSHLSKAFSTPIVKETKDSTPALQQTDTSEVTTTASTLSKPMSTATNSKTAVSQKVRAANVQNVDVLPTPSASVESSTPEEPVAIIGMSGRFPGADDLDAFWANLDAGRDSVSEIPAARWDWRAVEKREGKSSVRWGAFINGIDEFDPLFFGISPHEAEGMDPQQRLLMMYGWKALEDAGIATASIWGSKTGIFVGTANTGYSDLLRDHAELDGHSAAGKVPSLGPNRLSYLLNLHGPSEPIETACSSSLVAIHRAVRALQSGECTLALVGGVNTLITPEPHISFAKSGMLSEDGRCKTFSTHANGYVRGEGVGMIVLKTLSAAKRDGDAIYCVIRATAENHGGRATSLTAPNPKAQASLIQDAYTRAGISPRSVSYVEAHGTGTPLGDPVEINGLKLAFSLLAEQMGETEAIGYCGVGSVKSNIGHLELAAGIAGIIKVILQLQHRHLVKSLHCAEINPYIEVQGSPFYIVQEGRPWLTTSKVDGSEEPRRAGVSSFGFGGVNAHVLIEEYVSTPDGGIATHPAPLDEIIFLLSARSPEQLRQKANDLASAIADRGLDDTALLQLAYTLQTGRDPMEYRLGFITNSMAVIKQRMRAFALGDVTPGLVCAQSSNSDSSRSLFRSDDELHEAVEKWIAEGKWTRLLEHWVKGLEVDWKKMYGERRPERLRLPTYPFAKESYWIPKALAVSVCTQVGASPASPHPLLHRVESDLGVIQYQSLFTGSEFFLRDHQVDSEDGRCSILPAMVFLEMARAAIQLSHPGQSLDVGLRLLDIVWMEPVRVTGDTHLATSVKAMEDGRIRFDITNLSTDPAKVYCRGYGVFEPKRPTTVPLLSLQRQLTKRSLTPEAIYGKFDALGFAYGPSFRCIVSLSTDCDQALAELRLPQGFASTMPNYFLHPSLMDAGLQASIGLLVPSEGQTSRPIFPFALESIDCIATCTEDMFAWLQISRKSEAEGLWVLDVDLCDRNGHVCVRSRGWSLLPVSTSRASTGVNHEDLTNKARELAFDELFYQHLIQDLLREEISVDEATNLA